MHDTLSLTRFKILEFSSIETNVPRSGKDEEMTIKVKEKRQNVKDENVANWNAELQAKNLYSAIKGKISESAISDILGRLDHHRRVRLNKAYKEYTSRKLSHDVRAHLAGDFELTCRSVVEDPVTFLVKHLKNELNEFPTPHHQYIMFLLCERNNSETKAIADAYQKRYGQLKKALDDNLRPECSKLVQHIMDPLRKEKPVSPIQVNHDARDLIKLGIGVHFGDESEPMIYSLIRQRSYCHLRAILAEYKRLTRRGPQTCLEKTMPECQRLWLITFIEALECPETYCAKTLAKSASMNQQTFLKCLLILRLTRTIKFFRHAVQLFYEAQGEKLQDSVKRGFDGNARDLLLILIDV